MMYHIFIISLTFIFPIEMKSILKGWWSIDLWIGNGGLVGLYRNWRLENGKEGESMAKVQALEWKAFMAGEVKMKEVKHSFNWKKAAQVAAVGIVAMSALHTVPALASGMVVGKAVTALAADPSIFSQLHAASEPIRQLIFAAGHEIYFVFMAWGAIEAMIGKPAQGFARMKTATLAYVLLVWTPWIVDRVNSVTPLGA